MTKGSLKQRQFQSAASHRDIFKLKDSLSFKNNFPSLFHVEENTKRLITFEVFINYRKMEHSAPRLRLARKLIEWRDFKVAGTAHRIAQLKQERLIARREISQKGGWRILTFKAAFDTPILVVWAKSASRHKTAAFITFNAHSADHRTRQLSRVDGDSIWKNRDKRRFHNWQTFLDSCHQTLAIIQSDLPPFVAPSGHTIISFSSWESIGVPLAKRMSAHTATTTKLSDTRDIFWLQTNISDKTLRLLTKLFVSQGIFLLPPSENQIELIEMFWTTKLRSKDSLKFILKSENCFCRVSGKTEKKKRKEKLPVAWCENSWIWRK